MNNPIVHPSSRPLTQGDKAIFSGAIILVVLGLFGISAGGDNGICMGTVLMITGLVAYLYGRACRSRRMKNQV
jgi:hypothetical protein